MRSYLLDAASVQNRMTQALLIGAVVIVRWTKQLIYVENDVCFIRVIANFQNNLSISHFVAYKRFNL